MCKPAWRILAIRETTHTDIGPSNRIVDRKAIFYGYLVNWALSLLLSIVWFDHVWLLTMTNETTLRMRRGVTRASITHLCHCLEELKRTADQPNTLDFAQQLKTKLTELDGEFKTHHYNLIYMTSLTMATWWKENKIHLTNTMRTWLGWLFASNVSLTLVPLLVPPILRISSPGNSFAYANVLFLSVNLLDLYQEIRTPPVHFTSAKNNSQISKQS